jgi:hypothetical protein
MGPKNGYTDIMLRNYPSNCIALYMRLDLSFNCLLPLGTFPKFHRSPPGEKHLLSNRAAGRRDLAYGRS